MSDSNFVNQFEQDFCLELNKGAPVNTQRFWRGLFEAARILSELKHYQRKSLVNDAEPVSLTSIRDEVAAEYLYCPKQVVELITALTWLAETHVERMAREVDQ